MQKDMEMSKEDGATEGQQKDDCSGKCWCMECMVSNNPHCIAQYATPSCFISGIVCIGLAGYFLYNDMVLASILFLIFGSAWALSGAVLLCMRLFGILQELWMAFIIIELLCVSFTCFYMSYEGGISKTEFITVHYRGAFMFLTAQVTLIFILAVNALVLWLLGKSVLSEDRAPIDEEKYY